MSCIFALLGDNVLSIIPVLSLVCAVAILAGLLGQIRPKTANKSLGDIIHFVCFGLIVLIIFGSVSQLVILVKSTLLSLQTQMEIGFPILLTLMASIGATVSVGLYQPSVAILTGFMLTLCVNVLLPIFVFSVVFSVAGNISSSIKLNKFSGFFSNIFKWIVGIVFTVFSAFLTVQGISAGSFDGVSIRTAKFAIKSYIPILGSYLADGLNLILSSSILIKNAVGVAGLLLLFATIIGPLLKIIILQLGLNLVAGVLEPIAENRTSGFLSGVSKNLNMLIAIILAFSFAYFITVALIMCTSNVI
jgi:stage III sporulation protein AE